MPREAFAGIFRSLVCSALLIGAGFTAPAATARDYEIRYHEHIERLETNSAERISFVAYGRQFDLALQSNSGILAAQGLTGTGELTLYRGRIVGQADSWVRLSERAGLLSGALWDGSELWLIDSASRVAEFLTTPDSAIESGSVIFKLSEVTGGMGDAVGIVPQDNQTAAIELPNLAAAATFGPQPGRVLDIGLVSTADFGDEHGEQARAVLLEIFNVVEGIFITQVGVQLRAAEISVLNATPPSLQESDPQSLLRNFADYKATTPELRPLGLAHLFVGYDLDDLDPPVRTVGMANLSVLCDTRFSVGITQASHATILNALIAAHEIGHNFGAPHDAESGSVCAAEPDRFIMAPKISGSTRFSQCSIEQMMPEILGAGCMREIPPTDLKLSVDSSPPLQVHERDSVEFSVVLSNRSNTNVAGVELSAASTLLSNLSVSVDAIADGYCDSSTPLHCVWPWFPAGASVVLNASAFAEEPGSGTIDLSVDSLHELDQSDNSVQFDIEVLPLADLLSLLTPDSRSLHPGESARFEAAVFNRGDARTTGAIAHIAIDSRLELIGNELNDCTVEHAGNMLVYSCAIGTLRANQSLSFGFTARVPADIDPSSLAQDPTALIKVSASSDDIPIDEADPGAQAVVTIGDTINDLGVTIDGPTLAQVDEPATWQITIENRGPDAAESIRVFDDDGSRTLPGSNASVESSHGTCALIGNNTEFECAIPALGVGERAQITLTATPEQQGQFFWIGATVEAPAPDGNPDDNQTSLLVAVNAGETEAPGATAAGSDSGDPEDNSGGGGTGIVMLLLLAALSRERRLRQY